jgi:hypothetical protein
MRLKGQGSNTGLMLALIVILIVAAALVYFLYIAPR